MGAPKPLSPYEYPWARVGRAGSFFIPCLDTEAVIKEGLRAALLLRLRDAPRYKVGIYKGKLGVMFYRTSPESK